MSVYNPIVLSRLAFLKYKCRRLRHFLEGTESSQALQRQNLLHRLARDAHSRFGRDHGLSSVRTLDDFRHQVPVGDYERHRPYIEDVINGDVEALFAPSTKVLMFATTSGTTSQPKLLPVTEAFYKQYRASWQYWGTGVYRDYPELMQMQSLQFSSHWKVTTTPGGIPCGNISGLAAETRPFYLSSLFVLPAAVIAIMDHTAKHYTALRLSLASKNVGMIVTANPSTLIEVAKLADARKSELIRDIHDGTLATTIRVPGPIRDALRSRLKPDPRRARELEKLVSGHGMLRPKDTWPNLRLLAVWTGGAVGIYLSQLPQYYGDVAIRDHGMSASEGRMTIPLANDVREGLLDYRSHFFEFIPETEHGTANPTVLEAHELEPGQNYFILLTTAGGLYRYDIQDLTHCHGYEGQTPLLSFLNKGKHFSSFTGEKLSEHQVIQAMQASLERLRLPSGTFTLAPVMAQRPQYHLIVAEGPHADAGDRLTDEMQRQLETINIEYGDKCRSGRIDSIQLMTVPPETWDRLRAEKSRQRGNFEEYKHPCLTSDLNFIDHLRQLAES